MFEAMQSTGIRILCADPLPHFLSVRHEHRFLVSRLGAELPGVEAAGKALMYLHLGH